MNIMGVIKDGDGSIDLVKGIIKILTKGQNINNLDISKERIDKYKRILLYKCLMRCKIRLHGDWDEDDNRIINMFIDEALGY